MSRFGIVHDDDDSARDSGEGDGWLAIVDRAYLTQVSGNLSRIKWQQVRCLAVSEVVWQRGPIQMRNTFFHDHSYFPNLCSLYPLVTDVPCAAGLQFRTNVVSGCCRFLGCQKAPKPVLICTLPVQTISSFIWSMTSNRVSGYKFCHLDQRFAKTSHETDVGNQNYATISVGDPEVCTQGPLQKAPGWRFTLCD